MFTAIIGTACSSESQVSTPEGLCTALTVIASAATGMATLSMRARRRGRIVMVVASGPRHQAAGHGLFLQEMRLGGAAYISRLNRLDAVWPILDIGDGEPDRERGAVILGARELVVLLV